MTLSKLRLLFLIIKIKFLGKHKMDFCYCFLVIFFPLLRFFLVYPVGSLIQQENSYPTICKQNINKIIVAIITSLKVLNNLKTKSKYWNPIS